MAEDAAPTAMVLGATGTLGRAISTHLEAGGWSVIRATRGPTAAAGWTSLSDPGWASRVPTASLGGVVWAQGVNMEDSIADDEPPMIREALEANVVFVVETLRSLLRHGALAPGAAVVVVSSIWQELARDRRLSYSVSKSAVAGLVRSLTADLGRRGIRVNAVLPGVIDSDMTRRLLTDAQIGAIEADTPSGRLATAAQVAAVCGWLIGPGSDGVTGQFITVDGGWSDVRRLST